MIQNFEKKKNKNYLFIKFFNNIVYESIPI